MGTFCNAMSPNKQKYNTMLSLLISHSRNGGVWWLRGKFGALRPEGRRFESHSSRHVETLGKSFTRASCL